MTAFSSVLCRLILRTDKTGDVVIRKPRPLRQSPILFFTRHSDVPRLYTSSNRNVSSESRLPTVTSLSSRIFESPRMASVASAKESHDSMISLTEDMKGGSVFQRAETTSNMDTLLRLFRILSRSFVCFCGVHALMQRPLHCRGTMAHGSWAVQLRPDIPS
jgi:hypothetical protein